ncbi:MAG: flavin reductase family protein [Defluviitaleaceae bacterium]|nr:flavin reductase family protein [Defluviitaleaceae bacterium]MCL2275538.1 flavin reductase family protein [Defluviitaleaceae bacterium]
MKRKSIGDQHSMVVQPAFIIGTYNENGVANFAPITWVSITWDTDHYMLVISMNGTKQTKKSAEHTRALTANLVSTDMLPLMDYLGSSSGGSAPKDKIPYTYSKGNAVSAPTLDASKWVYECEVSRIVETGDTHTYFCRIKDVQVDETVPMLENRYDLAALDVVVYSGNYYSIGKHLGKIGDFAQ